MACTWKISECKMFVIILLHGYLWGMFGGLATSLARNPPVYEDGKTIDSQLRISFCALHGLLAIAFTSWFILGEFYRSSNDNETSNENEETSPLIPERVTPVIDIPYRLRQSRENVLNVFYTSSQSTESRNAVSFDLRDDSSEIVFSTSEKSCDSVGLTKGRLNHLSETDLYSDDDDDDDDDDFVLSSLSLDTYSDD
ncbi:uncharacterized protein LOC111620100 isoform X2 [Centruroides sculpturatus]|uniref:uncharacterized protein LOC111620100 isoform X1 n=1 Tax=Centruroides sculpturatus TaxID=218467 RepID=UPI000C6D6B9E|nr:uncharacterized protein LOC111620100 isoform X1 [Centruroides sculpturatus]XP_023217717.1 uncharacterized protein LOC111620100 isoform X2 [Centruroides sculpturatus]